MIPAGSIATAIFDRQAELGLPIVVGLSGAQGSGKSTLAPRIAALLAERGLRTAILALDDFYLTRAGRQVLSRTIHPLLATRGVPGTHDVALLDRMIDALLAGDPVAVPRFDKAADDRTGTRELRGPHEVLLLEGWCIGARPQPEAALVEPINALERVEDAGGTWRRWVNHRLASDYAALFARLDLRIFLRAPGFDVVERWRGEQEAQLGMAAMEPSMLARFVSHYERITRWMIEDEPADVVIALDANRTPTGARHPM